MKKSLTKSIILGIAPLLIACTGIAQTTWPCAQYITRQVPKGSGYQTNISYVYDAGVTPVTITVAKLDTLLNASVIYNGTIWAWKQYTGTAQSGSSGARLIKVNYNGLDSTVTPTITGYSFPTITMSCNAAFVDPNGIYYVINTANSGDGSFILSRINLTTPTPTLLSNLTVNLQGGNKIASGGLGDIVYRNDSVFALVNNVGLFRFALPPTSTTSVNSNLVGSSINRTIGSLFSINSDLNNIYGYGSISGGTAQDRLLKISTLTGVVTELTLGGVSVSQSDGAGCSSTDFSPPVFLNISGKVFDDANGLKGSPANTIDGTGTNAGGLLYAQLLDGTNAVESTIPIASNGTYTFTGLTPGTYTVLINNSSTSSTSTTLPSNWVNTGEYNAITAGSAGSDGTINGKSAAIILTLTNVANINFGIEQLPTANNVTASSQSNPGGTIKVTVPTLNGSDPEQGTLAGTGNSDTVIINTLPSNGTLYYNNVAVAPGDTIKNYNPSLLTVDPNSGAITVSFTYSEVDAALKSSSAATVSMPFTTISISGNVYDDGNGLTDNKVNGIGNNGGSLNAVLIDAGTGKTLTTIAVTAGGAYSITGLDAGNYSVEITTGTATIGTTAPAVTMPGTWFNTGENLGTAAGSDGTINGILSVGAVSANTTNANFGIEQPPVANAVTATSQPNPGGTNKVTVPTLNGSDPEQGTLAGTGNSDTVIINTLPSNGTLYYNNVAVAAGDTIKNYNPSLLTIDPNSGAITISFTYSEVDAALKSSSTATVSMPFTTISVSGNIYDDANGLTDNKVNGTGTNASSLNAVLIDAGTGKTLATTAVAASGTYSFADLDAGNYSIEITTATATIGTTTPAVTLPGTWFSTGENIGAGAGSDGTINGILSLGTISTNTTNANFGIEQPPVANTVTVTSQLNPGGTNKVTVPTLNGSDPEQGMFAGTGNLDTVIINTLPSSGTLYYNNVAVAAGDTIKNYNPSLLTVDPNSGAITISFTYSEVDAAHKSSSAATVSMPFTTINISGNVYDDANGLTDNTANGNGTNAGGLNAVLINSTTGKVTATTTVAADGSYSFNSLDGGNYNIEITTNTATVGTTAPAVTLPGTWFSTGENLGAGAGSDGTINGILSVGAVSANTTNANFGIEQPPVANAVTATSQPNPGGTIKVTVPTLNGSDPEQGTLAGTSNSDTVIINTLPSNGTLYYNNVAVAAGDTIKNYNPSLLTVNPNSGAITVSFTYSEVDAALKSSSAATVSMPFTTISVSGNVYDDANGLTDNKVNGTGTNTGSLNAVLIDASTGKTLATTAVAAGGAYSFSGLDAGNYSVEITTGTATIGTTAPAVTLPGTWFNTGENLGAGTGNDGTVNGILLVGSISTNTANVNFGIEQPPVVNAVTAASQPNPGGTNKVNVPTLNGSDPEQGTYSGTSNTDTVIIKTIPGNGTLYYNSIAVVAGDTIKNYNPTLLTIDPNDGAITVSFTYTEIDAALQSGASATVSIPFTTFTLSGNVLDDANGLTDNTVNGTGTNAGGLNALLIDAVTGNVLVITTVAADGTYSFGNLNTGNYNVSITTNTATPGNAPPVSALPINWLSTGENLGTAVGSDGTINGILPIGLIAVNAINANFGIEQLPTANNVSASYINPGGTNTVQAPTLNGTDPEQGIYSGTSNRDTVVIKTLPASGTLYYNGVAVAAGDTIKNYNHTLLTFDPPNGSGTYSFTYTETDAAIQSSSPATATMNFNSISIAGTISDDANGLTDNTVNGTGTNAGGLNAILVDAATGNAIAATTVATDGTYSFNGLDAGNYNVAITTNTVIPGNALPAITLPAGWLSTGENIGTGIGNDGTVNAILPLGTISTNTINADFGIEQVPVANTVTASSQQNPGGIVKVTVPTLNGSDPEQGALPGTGNSDKIIINTLPSNGILYYNNIALAASDTIKNYNPSLLTVDPNSGAVTISFTYSEVDAALKAGSPATASMPFTTLDISGSVFDDANGLSDNIVNGTGINAGGLNAVLIDAATGNAVATTAVAADGTYDLTGIDAGNYNVEITTNTATIGSTAPVAMMPFTWVSIGENLGAGIGSDGTVNGILSLGIVSTNTADANFGIEQLPTSDNKLYTIIAPAFNSVMALNGSGLLPGPLSGSDPEDGTMGATKKLVITSVPTNIELYYDGAVVTNNTIIDNYDPSKLELKFNVKGILNTSFQYSFIDAAGNQRAIPAIYSISWAMPLPVVLSGFNAEKQNDYVVLNWSTSSELNVKMFNVERSTDNGKTWQPVGEVMATGNSASQQRYSFTDPNPENGTNLYRLQVEDNNGSITYSKTSQVEMQLESTMKVFPNPVGQEEALNIQLTGLKAGAYKISMISASGQTVKGMTFNITNSGTATLVIPTGSTARGTYVILVKGDNYQISRTVVVANR